MSAIPVIAIFDVGKTNKKFFLLDEDYRIVYEITACFTETIDEDGDACENLENLQLWVCDSLREALMLPQFVVKALNFSAYGASFVHIDEKGEPVAPLYNYLKDYPSGLKAQFYETYGGEAKMAKETCSPVLGNLNSGMQLYRIKYRQPQLFNRIKYSLHLPQYLSYLFTGKPCTDITSIGCHTGLWDFKKHDYHAWVYKEGLDGKFAPIISSDSVMPGAMGLHKLLTGVGLHDSSAALIPYLLNFSEPFVLISTGTWCISLNPFNNTAITEDELVSDCLCYMRYNGVPVKASRLFAGNDHELQVKRIAKHFNADTSFFKDVLYDPAIISKMKSELHTLAVPVNGHPSAFAARELGLFANYTEAYHRLMLDIMDQQYQSTQMILSGPKIRRIFVDGGFNNNPVYMNLLAAAFPGLEVFAAAMAQATALGAAMAIHQGWNSKPLPAAIIELKYYAVPS